MPRAKTVAAWREDTERTIEDVASAAGTSVRATKRYLKGERPWPFEAVRRLKKASGNVLTDASFASVGDADIKRIAS